MESRTLIQLICVALMGLVRFAESKAKVFPDAIDLLDFGTLLPDPDKGFEFDDKSPTYQSSMSKFFEGNFLPEEFSISAVFTPKKDKAFIFALLSPDSETIRIGLSINKTQPAGVTSRPTHEIFFWYNDDVTKHGYQPPAIRAVVPDFLESPGSIEWKVGVHVNGTQFSIYWHCDRDATPEFKKTIPRISMGNKKAFFEKGASIFLMSGGPVYESKFEGSIKELVIYNRHFGIRQRCANKDRYPSDDDDTASGFEPPAFRGNVFKAMTTIAVTSTTEKPTTRGPKVLSSKELRSVNTGKATKATEEPLSNPMAKGDMKQSPKDTGCAGDFEDNNFEDGKKVPRKPCRKNFLKTSTTPKPTTTTPMPTTTTTTTPAPPKKCTCKGIKGDMGPPGPPGKCPSSKKKMEIGGEWKLLPETTVKPIPPAKGEKGDRGIQGERGIPGLPCKPPPGGKVVVKGGKVKFVEGKREWQLVSTTTPRPLATAAPRLMKGEKGTKGERGVKGPPCDPPTIDYSRFNVSAAVPGLPGRPGPPGPPGSKGTKGESGRPGVCPRCEVKTSPGTKGAKGDAGVCTRPCDRGMPGQPGPRGLKGDKGDSSTATFDPTQVEKMIQDVILRPRTRNYFRGQKGEPGNCQGGKSGGGCGLGGGCTNDCNRGPPGARGPPGIGLDKLESFGYGAIVFADMRKFEPVSSYFPAGSMALIRSMDDRGGFQRGSVMLIKVDADTNEWQEMVTQFGRKLTIGKPRSTRRPLPPTPQSITEEKIVHSSQKLYLIALDDPMRGNLGDNSGNGHAMAEHMCETNARAVRLTGDFGVVLGHEYLQLQNLVAQEERSNVPIVNLKGQILYNSWDDFVGGARMNPSVRLYTFSGKDVLTETIGQKKRVWLGSDNKGKTSFYKTPTCRFWTSASTKKFGLAGSLTSGNIFDVNPLPCSENAFVLCIKTTTSARYRYRRRK